MSKTHEITRWLEKWSNGDQKALDKLLPVVYAELHKQAVGYLRHERQNHTLQPTALIHEAYLKLIDQREINLKNRTHFFAIAATLMRRVLVDHARAKHRKKRGGNAPTIQLNEEVLGGGKTENLDLLALEEVLNRLKEKDERQVKIIELKFFGGLTLDEIAAALDLSRSTVAQDWKMAKVWIYRELTR